VSDVLAGVLAALISTNAPAAASNMVQRTTGISVDIPNPNDPVEREFRELLEYDDSASDDVLKWTDAANTSSATGDDSAQSTLRFRIHRRLEGVKERYTDFLQRHPDYVRALLAYGSFLNQTGENDEAKTEWEKARQLAPNNPAAWDDLGTLYEEGDVKKSFEYFSKAIELDPSQSVYYHNLAAAVYLFRKDAAEYWKISDQEVYDKALGLYQKAVKLAPDDFILASDYAMCFYGINPPRWKDGLAAWTQCLKIAPDERDREGVYIHLARMNLALFNFDEARRNLASITNETYAVLKNKISRNIDETIQNVLTNGTPQLLR
jgi:tetratricopeptide (TPR) repeat protein